MVGAVVALIELGHGDFLFAALGGFEESNLHIVAQIRAALWPGRIGAAAAKEVVEDASAPARSKSFLENIKGIVESAPGPTTAAHARIKSGVAILIVSRPLLRVAQSFVGFADFLEFVLGGLIAGILVRMKLDGQFPIGFFDFLFGGLPLHFQDFVIIAPGPHALSAGFLATTTPAGRRRRSRSL